MTLLATKAGARGSYEQNRRMLDLDPTQGYYRNDHSSPMFLGALTPTVYDLLKLRSSLVKSCRTYTREDTERDEGI